MAAVGVILGGVRDHRVGDAENHQRVQQVSDRADDRRFPLGNHRGAAGGRRRGSEHVVKEPVEFQLQIPRQIGVKPFPPLAT